MGKIHGFEAPKLTFGMTAAVAAALERLGRTEDVKFSPNGKQLAIADYSNNQLLVLDLASTVGGVNATDCLEVSGAELRLPHGLSWIDDHTLIVANRIGDVCIFALPEKKPKSRSVELASVAKIAKADFAPLKNPGSVTVSPLSANRFEVLVCSFPTDLISRHVLNTTGGYSFTDHSVYLEKNVVTPDGVIRSPSLQLLAVSNHRAKCVSIFNTAAPLNRSSVPDAQLFGVGHPHGLQMSADENFLFAADAGEPFIHVYCNSGKGWKGDYNPVHAIRIMDDVAFIKGNVNDADGGSKGIGLNPAGTTLAVTCEEAPLAFYDVRPILATTEFPEFVKPAFPQLPPKPPKPFLLRIWKKLRRKLKQRSQFSSR